MFSLVSINVKTIPSDIIYAKAPKINSGIKIIDNVVNKALPASENYASVNPIQIILTLAELAWLIGIGLIIIYSLVTTIKLISKLKDSVHIRGNIYKNKQIKTPFVFGLIKAKIYLPANLSDTEKSYIIKHEQTHIERYDHIIKFIGFAVLIVHWFNPLVWLAFILMTKDMELSCDEKVINDLGSGIKKDYSNSILSLSSGKKIMAGSPLAFAENDTKGRIKNILNYKKPKVSIILIILIILIAAFVGLTTNPKKDSRDFAKQFLEVLTSPKNKELSKYYDNDSDFESSDDINKFADLIENEYGELMTDEALNKAISNRNIPFAELLKNDDRYNIEVKSIDLVEQNTNEKGKDNYTYLLSLQVLFSSGKSSAATVSGDIVMIKEKDDWKVYLFKQNPDYQEFYSLLVAEAQR